MFTLFFWKGAAERAVKTAAQAVVLLFLAGDHAVNAFSVDYGQAAGFALGAAVLSILTSLISANIGPSDSPSVVNTEPAITPAEEAEAVKDLPADGPKGDGEL